MTCAPTLELVHSPTLPLTGGLGGPQPAEGKGEKTVTSVLVPAQLMAETLIFRGLLYFPSRTTVVVLVVMD